MKNLLRVLTVALALAAVAQVLHKTFSKENAKSQAASFESQSNAQRLLYADANPGG